MTSLATYGVNAFLRFVVKRSLSKHALTPNGWLRSGLSWKGPAPGAGGPASSASPPTPSALSPRSGRPSRRPNSLTTRCSTFTGAAISWAPRPYIGP